MLTLILRLDHKKCNIYTKKKSVSLFSMQWKDCVSFFSSREKRKTECVAKSNRAFKHNQIGETCQIFHNHTMLQTQQIFSMCFFTSLIIAFSFVVSFYHLHIWPPPFSSGVHKLNHNWSSQDTSFSTARAWKIRVRKKTDFFSAGQNKNNRWIIHDRHCNLNYFWVNINWNVYEQLRLFRAVHSVMVHTNYMP